MLGRNGSTRALALVALVALALGLTACGGSSGSSSTGTNASVGSTDPANPGTTGTTPANPGTTGTTPANPSTKTQTSPSTKPHTGSAPKVQLKPPSKQTLKKAEQQLKKLKLKLHLKLNLNHKHKGSSKSSSPPSLATVNAATAALRACMKQQGIPLASGSKLPHGISSSRYKEALNACLSTLKLPSQGSSNSSERSYAKFVACMRQNGINMPDPNTSGKGPVLSTSGIDTGSAQFNSAYAKCQSHLPGIKEIAIGPLSGNNVETG